MLSILNYFVGDIRFLEHFVILQLTLIVTASASAFQVPGHCFPYCSCAFSSIDVRGCFAIFKLLLGLIAFSRTWYIVYLSPARQMFCLFNNNNITFNVLWLCWWEMPMTERGHLASTLHSSINTWIDIPNVWNAVESVVCYRERQSKRVKLFFCENNQPIKHDVFIIAQYPSAAHQRV